MLHYQTGGDAMRPCLVLSNSLGTDLGMWAPQAAALARDFFVLRYDTRGHGRSATGQGMAGIDQLGQDVIGLLDQLGIERAHFCGISMGGLTGQWLAIHAPQRIGKLVLANTAARIGTAEGWAARAALVRREGMGAVADGAAARWFTDDFIAREPGVVGHMIARLRTQDAEGYAACCEALAHCDLRDAVGTIACPALVIAGSRDPVTTVADAQWLVDQVPGAGLATVEASHLSNIEAPEEFTHILRRFLLD
jgi:3-oxoadipate enol-lactonase